MEQKVKQGKDNNIMGRNIKRIRAKKEFGRQNLCEYLSCKEPHNSRMPCED